jgi:small subunit ribosomal protein S21
VNLVPKVIAREGESFQVTLRKFKKSCEKAGLLSDIKKNNYYEKPSVERRRKEKEARRKALKLLRKQNRYNKNF